LRPLLAARRTELRAWLSAQDLRWLEDPANADPRFARSRARAQLAGDQAMGEGFALPGESPCVERLAQTVAATADGRLVLPRQGLAAAPQAAVRRVVSAALVCAGGGVKPPRGVRLDRIISAVDSGEMWVCTLAGARVVTRGGDGAIQVERDAGERARGGLAAFNLSAGEVGVFDGRYEVWALNVSLRVVGLAGCLRRLDRASRMRLGGIPASHRGALPAVIDADGVVRLPAPFGDGPAVVRSLVGERFAAACGLADREAALATSLGMAL
jgi:tRNA(Ile)-lysidine synthase